MERLTKVDEMYFKHITIRELEEAIKEIEMTLEEDGEITNRFIDGQELLFRLKCANEVLKDYFDNEKRLFELLIH